MSQPIEPIHMELFGNEISKFTNKDDKNFLSELWRLALSEINEMTENKCTEEELKIYAYNPKNYPTIKKYKIAIYHMKNALYNCGRLNLWIDSKK